MHLRPAEPFGSSPRAPGEARSGSDADLLVVLPHVDGKREAAVRIRQLLSDLPIAKDVVVTTPEEIARRGDLVGTVLRPALREATILYEKPAAAQRSWHLYDADVARLG